MDRIEALEAQLPTLEDGNDKLRALCELSESYGHLPGKYSESLTFAEQAYALAVRLGDAESLVRGLLSMGKSRLLTDAVSALPYLQEAKKIANKSGSNIDNRHRFVAISALANGLDSLNRHNESLSMYLEAMELAKLMGDVLYQAIVCANLAALYHKLGHKDPAMEHARNGLQMSQQIGDSYGCMHANMILGSIVGDLMQDHSGAIEYFHEALEIADRYNYMPTRPLVRVNIAEAYIVLGQPEKSGQYLAEAEPILRAEDYKDMIVYCLSVKGDCEAALNNPEQAALYYQEALALAEGLEDQYLQYRTHAALSQFYKQQGELGKALDHYEQFHQIKEELLSQKMQDNIQALTVQYDLEKAKAEKNLAEKEREIERLKNEELSVALEEVRALNDRLLELNNEKNEMLGIVAHDLKSPLSGARMVSAMLKEHHHKMASAELSEQLENLEQTNNRMLRIVTNLLHVQAVESRIVYMAEEDMDVSVEVGQIVQSYRAEAGRKGVELYSSCEPELHLWGSREALEQVVENLVSNALKFSSAGDRVWVRTRRVDEDLLIEVEDEGPGIGIEDRQKLFEKYGRLSARPTGGEVSTGLGLWIARKLVDVLHGRIYCYSSVGKGTTFRVEIPVATLSV